MPFATFIEKDNITSLTKSNLVHRTINSEPDEPSRPYGKEFGKVGEEYTYTSSATDIEKDMIYYLWGWGDGNFSDWLGPFDSGERCTISHSWGDPGTYNVRAKAKDVVDYVSDWSDNLTVVININY